MEGNMPILVEFQSLENSSQSVINDMVKSGRVRLCLRATILSQFRLELDNAFLQTLRIRQGRLPVSQNNHRQHTWTMNETTRDNRLTSVGRTAYTRIRRLERCIARIADAPRHT